MLKCCLNWKVIVGLGVVTLAVWAAAPDAVGRALPLLVGLICPLSMIVMMVGMRGMGSARPATPTESSPPALQLPVSREQRLAQLRREKAEVQAELAKLDAPHPALAHRAPPPSLSAPSTPARA